MKINIIYLIDDDDTFAKIFVKDMEKFVGHKVIRFGSVETGLEYAKIDKPEVVFLDHNLDGEKGIDSIPKWRKINSKIQIIIITSSKDPSDLKKALKSGVSRYMNKDVYLLGEVHKFLHELKTKSFLTRFIKRFSQSIG